MKARDGRIELLRCLLMFGICFLHANTFGYEKVPDYRSWLPNIFTLCVPAFVFISGWYGIRLRWSKIGKLYGLSFVCAILTMGVRFVVDGTFPDGWRQIVSVLRRDTFMPWFLNVYAMLMIVAPLLNLAIERMERKDLKTVYWPLAALVFVYGGCLCKVFSKGLHFSLPKPDCLGGYTLLMMVAVYVTAAVCRKFELLNRIRVWQWGMTILVSLAGMVAFVGYISPFAILASAGIFALMQRVQIPAWLGHTAVFLGPSMFPVYLLTADLGGRHYVDLLKEALIANGGMNNYVAYVIIAIVLFGGAILVDVAVRRPAGWLLRRVVRLRG